MVKDVSKTKIASFHVGYATGSNQVPIPAQLIVYAATVDSTADTNAFVLPVFNPSNDPNLIIPLDMSHMSDFFDGVDNLFQKWFRSNSLDGESYSMTNSWSANTVLPVYTVGDYNFSIMPNKKDFNRIDRSKLTINPGAKVAIDAHTDDYSFIVCQFFKKGKLNISPFGYLCTHQSPTTAMIIPTVHGHPHDENIMPQINGIGYVPNIRLNFGSGSNVVFEDTAHFDHEIYVLFRLPDSTVDSTSRIRLDGDDLRNFNTILKQITHDYRKLPVKLYVPKNVMPKKIKIKGTEKNRNFAVDPVNSYFYTDLLVDPVHTDR